MVLLCPEGVQNKCPGGGGGVWCRGFMSCGDTLICVISRGVQLFYGIAQFAQIPLEFNVNYSYVRLHLPAKCRYTYRATCVLNKVPAGCRCGTRYFEPWE